MTQQLSVATLPLASGTVIEVSGELDHHTAPQLRALLPTLALAPGQQILIDLGGLTFCDSSGITVLIAARNHALATQATIALIAVPDRVHRTFKIVGLDQVFPAFPSVEEAENAWKPPQAP